MIHQSISQCDVTSYRYIPYDIQRLFLTDFEDKEFHWHNTWYHRSANPRIGMFANFYFTRDVRANLDYIFD